MTVKHGLSAALLLACACACGGGDDPRPAGAPLPAGCDPADVVATTACEFVRAGQGGPVDGLDAQERRLLERTGGLPDRSWDLAGCELVGDVTAACRARFADGTVVTLTVVPRNGEYLDGRIVVPDGERLDYSVVEVDGAGPSSSPAAAAKKASSSSMARR